MIAHDYTSVSLPDGVTRFYAVATHARQQTGTADPAGRHRES